MYSGKSEIAFEPRDVQDAVSLIQSTFDCNNISGWVSKILRDASIWREKLNTIPGFEEEVTRGVEAILNNGMKQALSQWLQD